MAGVAILILLASFVVVLSGATRFQDGVSCVLDTKAMLNFLYINRSVSVSMLTSSGLGINSVGRYDQCLSFGSPIAKFCLLRFTESGVAITQGLCIPANCSISGVGKVGEEIFQALLNVSFPIPESIHCGRNEQETGSVGFVLVTSAAVILVSITLYATYVDRHNPQKGVHSLLADFSLVKNWRQLSTQSPSRKYKALDGIRSLSMFLIIIGHTVNFMMNVGFVDLHTVSEQLQLFSSQLLLGIRC